MIQLSGMDSQQLLADRIRERAEQDDEAIKLMEKHPRCAILPSPEKLDESIGFPGSDKTDTLRDFDLIKDWVTTSELLNTEFHKLAATAQQFSESWFNSENGVKILG